MSSKTLTSRMLSLTARTSIVQEAVAELGEPPAPTTSESTALAVNVADPAAVGFPVMAPVAPSNVRPPGSAPPVIENRYGVTPPVADNEDEYASPGVPLPAG